jgi:hypothetical protein
MNVEQTSSHDLFDSDVYYSVEMIRELMPFLDDITYLIVYKSINAKFLDADDIAGVDKEIARHRMSYDHIMKRNLALFDTSQNKIEENE